MTQFIGVPNRIYNYDCQLTVNFGVFTADSIKTVIAPRNCVIQSVKLISVTDLAKSDTDNIALGIVNKGTVGTGTTTVVDITDVKNGTTDVATATAITAYKAWDATLSTTLSDITLNQNDVLAVTLDETGTVSLADVIVVITVRDI